MIWWMDDPHLLHFHDYDCRPRFVQLAPAHADGSDTDSSPLRIEVITIEDRENRQFSIGFIVVAQGRGRRSQPLLPHDLLLAGVSLPVCAHHLHHGLDDVQAFERRQLAEVFQDGGLEHCTHGRSRGISVARKGRPRCW